MKTIITLAFVLSSAAAFASKSYQVTGPVTDIGNDTITVTKGKEKFEIAKDAATKGATEIKKGDKVTVYYTMSATEVESKPNAKAKK